MGEGGEREGGILALIMVNTGSARAQLEGGGEPNFTPTLTYKN